MCVWLPAAKRLTHPLQPLALQRLRGGEFALGVQQQSEIVDAGERVLVPTAEVSRRTFSASRYSGSASSYLPWSCSSVASLFHVKTGLL